VGTRTAAAITCPVLSMLGSQSSPLFVEGRQLLHAWFPACQDADIAGATPPAPDAGAEAGGGSDRRLLLTGCTQLGAVR
jgi:hypothetical protein